MLAKIKVPTLPESVSEVTIGTFYKNQGDFVKKGDVICELETAKASLEVTATEQGVISKVNYKGDDEVKEGDVLCEIDTSKSADDVEPTQATVEDDKETDSPSTSTQSIEPETDSSSEKETDKIASPAAKKILKEQAISPNDVTSSTAKGVISKHDAISHNNNKSTTSAPSKDTQISSESGTVSRQEHRVKMTKLRKVIAKRLKETQNTAAMLTTFNEVNMDNVINLRSKYKDLFEKRYGVKLGFMSIFSKAVSLALLEIPEVNASISGDEIVYKKYSDISVAVSTNKGLVVPVVRNVQSLSLAEIEKEIISLAEKGRNGTLTPSDMSGGTFTITNGGVFGSLMSTPIINPPQSAILGMHATQKRPVVINDEIKIANMMYLALSYDHRIIDGKEAVTFLRRVKEMIEDPARVFLSL